MADGQWLSERQAASYVSLTAKQFRGYVKRGVMPPPSGARQNGSPLWDPSAIDAVFLSSESGAPDRGANSYEHNLLSLEKILARAIPWPATGTGIYFLIREDEVVYVGQAVNVTARLAEHSRTKQFDRWFWVPCDIQELNAAEKRYIRALMPKLNRALTGSYHA